MNNGYLGLSSRVSTHLGIGGDIVAFGNHPRAMRLMSGLRMALSSGDSGATLLVLDVDHVRATWGDYDYRSVGLICGLALVR
jgi:hypothetical protein